MKKHIATLGIAGTLVFGASGVAVVDQRIDPYTDKSTHYELPIKSDIPQGERVEIAKDRAEVTLKGWNDEYAIKIIPQDPNQVTFGFVGSSSPLQISRDFQTPANRPLLSKRMEYKSGDVTAFIEPNDKTNEAEIGMILEKRPVTDTFCYAIESAEQFDWFKQPPLTPEEIDEGAFRPDNVINSFAVYHKVKANHRVGDTNYATGKAFHRYRAEATDDNGDKVWADDSNYSNGIVCDTFPTLWLDKAVYPVKI